MAECYHMGFNVGAITGLPFFTDYYPTNNAQLSKFDVYLKGIKYKYQLAVTANTYQTDAGRVLKDNGFKKQLTFYSSHPQPETLTLWVKRRKRLINMLDRQISYPGGWNCSVSFTREIGSRMIAITVKSPYNKKDILSKDFKRVGSTPIWFNVRKNKIVKE